MSNSPARVICHGFSGPFCGDFGKADNWQRWYRYNIISCIEARKQLGLAQRDIAAAMGVSIAQVSQVEHGGVTSFEVVARYVEALGGRLVPGRRLR